MLHAREAIMLESVKFASFTTCLKTSRVLHLALYTSSMYDFFDVRFLYSTNP